MSDILDIDWVRLSFGSVFVLLLVLISLIERLKLERQILFGVFRATIQLTLMGYVIEVIIKADSPYVLSGIFLLMCLIGGNAIVRRLGIKGSYWQGVLALSLTSLFITLWTTQLIITLTPWYNARYMLPLLGMVLANGVNGVTLGGERYRSEMKIRREEVELFLSLGYRSIEAVENIRRKAFVTALTPSLNNLALIGIVHLPGIMTGQIMAGVNPLLAIKYQIVIVLSIVFSNGVATYIFLKFLQRYYFTKHNQLRYDRLLNSNITNGENKRKA